MQLNKNLYIFPTNRAIREYIETLKPTNQLLDKSISIGDFFNRVLLTNNKTLINKDLQKIYLQQAVSNIDITSLGLSSNFSKFYTQSEFILKFFNELNSEYNSFEDIEQYDMYSLYTEHLTLLKQIYKEYITLLNNNNSIDNITLPLYSTINTNYIKEYNTITIFYEGFFSKFEYNIIEQISQHTTVILHLHLNKFNIKNQSIFKNFNLEVGYKYILNISNNTIISKKQIQPKQNKYSIYSINQRITQVAFIKKAIYDMINQGIEASKIAIILPDESFSQYLKLFDNEKYFNFAMGNDINSSYTVRRFDALQSMLNKYEPQDNARFAFVKLDMQYIQQNIQPYYNKYITKEILFNLIDFISENEPNEQIKDKIVDLKLSLEILLFNNNLDITLKDSMKILSTKLHKITLDDVAGGKITVLGILETRYIKYDGVIVIDFNDNKVPKRSIKDKFISSDIKKFIDMPTIQDRQELQKYYYSKLFSNAQEIYISFVKNDQENISRFAQELFSQSDIIDNNFSNILQHNTKLDFIEDNITLDIDLSKQQWSATALKTYLQCKRKYYLNYIAQIKEHHISLKPPAYTIGQIIHNILDTIVKNNNYTFQTIQNEINKYKNQNPYLNLELNIWEKRLEKFLEFDLKRIENNIKIISTEKAFKTTHNGILIKGSIDRIEQLSDNSYTVLDYKTSSSLTIDHNTDFQLEFYALALKELNISKVAYYDLYHCEIIPVEDTLHQNKLTELDEIFQSLKTTTVEFNKCDTTKHCTYCIYKNICNRT